MGTANATPTTTDYRKWLKQAGELGISFFFVKGTMWMAAPPVFYYLR